MGHYGHREHDRAAEEAAAQIDIDQQYEDYVGREAQAYYERQHLESQARAHAEEEVWIELERAWQEAHCADITHTMAFSDGLATARKMLLTVEQAHRAACDAYNSYSADQAPKTWREWCLECIEREIKRRP